ncbi:hypothetical protein K432DRAFT_440020 [Lepidopterella palustris CBS 459.81]|uniref:Uncharacterized protein n=1 Tax=Lepidopterella palustris CBS 459.81 TaxID=1314670 RepID=A0A8E2JJN3_9PEZI|nr:hypothetical protein K432DRAFT_440020 [Lepidopterella palustris CBS 459.81]
MSTVPHTAHEDGRGERNEQGRPWSLGSDLLGHYAAHPPAEDPHTSHGSNHNSFQSSGIIEIHDGTREQVQEEDDRNMDGGPPRLIRASTSVFDRVITDWWWWELFSWFVSFFATGAIVIVLVLYSEQTLPRWPLGITLNAYISVLAALAKAAMILPVAEAIGQLKWIWFRRKSKLMDFFTFDSASRGPWGSLMLLGTTRCRRLASLGAIITILSLAFEPFFQQIVAYPERPIVQGNGSVSAALSYNVDTSFHSPGLSNDQLMMTTIEASIFGSNETVSPPPSTCPTGNCTWPLFSSLGNYTAVQLVQGITTDYACGYVLNSTLMVGTFIELDSSKSVLSMTMMATSSPGNNTRLPDDGPQFNSAVFEDIAYPILDFYVAYMPGGKDAVMRNDTPVMLECMLDWCVKTYESSQAQGVLNETIVSTFTNQTAKRLSTSELQSGNPPVVITPQVGGNTFNVYNQTTYAMSRVLSSYLSLFILLDDANSTMTTYGGIYDFLLTSPYDITPYLDTLGTAISNNLRRKIKGTTTVTGPAWGSQTFVRIHWVWISVPVFLEVASLVFLLCTIVKSSKEKVGVWKTSALAMLLHGLTGEARHKLDPESSLSEVEATARKVHVVLSPDKESTRLVLV